VFGFVVAQHAAPAISNGFASEEIARNMAFKRAMLRKPHWWIELIGIVLQIIAMFITPPGSARLILMTLGLGLFFFGAKSLYNDSQREANSYTLFSKRGFGQCNRSQHTPAK
jgi:hypothetical protein